MENLEVEKIIFRYALFITFVGLRNVVFSNEHFGTHATLILKKYDGNTANIFKKLLAICESVAKKCDPVFFPKLNDCDFDMAVLSSSRYEELRGYLPDFAVGGVLQAVHG